MPTLRPRKRKNEDEEVQGPKKQKGADATAIPVKQRIAVDIYSKPKLTPGSSSDFIGQPSADILANARVADGGVYPVNFKKAASVPYVGGAAHEKQKQTDAKKKSQTFSVDPAVKPSDLRNDDIIPHEKYDSYKAVRRFKNTVQPFDVLLTMGDHKGRIYTPLLNDFRRRSGSGAFTALLQLMYKYRFLFYSEISTKFRGQTGKKAVSSGSLARLLYVYISHSVKTPQLNIYADTNKKRKSPRRFFMDLLKYHLKELVSTDKDNLHKTPTENKNKQQVWAVWLGLLNDLLPYLVISESAEHDWRGEIKSIYRDAFPSSNPKFRAIQGILEIGDKSALPKDLVERTAAYKVQFAMAPHRVEMSAAKQGRALARQNIAALDFTESSILAAKKAMIDSSFFLDKALLVELSVGARMIEVLKVSDFYLPEQLYGRSPPQGEPGSFQPGSIVQHGVAKDRHKVQIEEDSDGNLRVVDIDIKDAGDFDKHRREAHSVRTLQPKPVLFTLQPEYIRYLVYEVIRPNLIPFLSRSGRGGMSVADATHLVTQGTNQDLTQKLAHIMIQRTKSFFPGTSIIGTHTLRKIYANYSYDTYADKKITRNAWIQQVLGHAAGAIGTSISYTGLVVTRPLAIAPPDWENQHAQLVSSVTAIDKAVTRAIKQTTQEVTNTNTIFVDGVAIKKVARTRAGIEHRAELLLEKYKELLSQGVVKPSRSQLRSLGFGSAVVSYFKKHFAAEIDMWDIL